MTICKLMISLFKESVSASFSDLSCPSDSQATEATPSGVPGGLTMDPVTWLMSCPVAGAQNCRGSIHAGYAQSLRHLGSMLDRYAVSWLSIIEGSHGPKKVETIGEFRASWNLRV